GTLFLANAAAKVAGVGWHGSLHLLHELVGFLIKLRDGIAPNFLLQFLAQSLEPLDRCNALLTHVRRAMNRWWRCTMSSRSSNDIGSAPSSCPCARFQPSTAAANSTSEHWSTSRGVHPMTAPDP